MKSLRCIRFVAIALLSCPIAYASPLNWTVTVDKPVLSGASGSTLVFTGSIKNNTGADLFLDSLNIDFTTSLPAVDYIKDYSDDFLSTLGDIPVSGYSGALFYIQWASGTPAGTGTGTFDLVAESPANPTSYAVPFTASITNAAVTPEPDSWLLCLSGSVFGSVLYWRRSRSLPSSVDK